MPIVPLPLIPDSADTMPCGAWTTWDDVTECRDDLDAITEEADQDRFIAIASALLYKRTHRRYPGICEQSVAVCQECVCPRRPCRCDPRHKVDLSPWLPVVEVSQVLIDGDILATDAYRVYAHRWLVRVDDEGWPLGSPIEDEAFAVTFTWGTQPGADGRWAAAAYAAELAADCIPGAVCKLPKRLRSMSKESGTYELSNSDTDALLQGFTGLPEIDSFLSAEAIDRMPKAGMFDPLRRSSLRGL